MEPLEDILGKDDGGMAMGMGEDSAPVAATNPCYAQLIEEWRSEEACPELLQWRGDLVDGLVPFSPASHLFK